MKGRAIIKQLNYRADESDDDNAPSMTVSRTVLGSFVDARNYRTCRLRKKSSHHDRRIAWNVSKNQKWLETKLEGMESDGYYSISILAFVKDSRYACDSIGIDEEEVATWLFSHFMREPLS